MICLAVADAFSWPEWAAAWGPAVPMFALLMYYLHQHVFVIMPKFLNGLQKTVKKEARQAKKRHMEAMLELNNMCDRLEKLPLRRRTTKEKPPAKR